MAQCLHAVKDLVQRQRVQSSQADIKDRSSLIEAASGGKAQIEVQQKDLGERDGEHLTECSVWCSAQVLLD